MRLINPHFMGGRIFGYNPQTQKTDALGVLVSAVANWPEYAINFRTGRGEFVGEFSADNIRAAFITNCKDKVVLR